MKKRLKDPMHELTATERTIVAMVANGDTNREISNELGLSPRTIETYRLRLMRKLNLRGTAGLVKFALRQNLTTLDG